MLANITKNEATLDALGSPTRREIIRILSSGPKPVGTIASKLPVSRPAVSKHLQVLENAKLVTHEQQGNRNIFQLNQEGFEDAKQWLDSFWQEALFRFATVAENLTEEKL